MCIGPGHSVSLSFKALRPYQARPYSPLARDSSVSIGGSNPFPASSKKGNLPASSNTPKQVHRDHCDAGLS